MFCFYFFIYFIYYIIENLWAFSSSWTQYQPDKTESCLEIQIQITVKRASLSFPDKQLGILFWNIIFYISHFFWQSLILLFLQACLNQQMSSEVFFLGTKDIPSFGRNMNRKPSHKKKVDKLPKCNGDGNLILCLDLHYYLSG